MKDKLRIAKPVNTYATLRLVVVSIIMCVCGT